MTGTSPIADPAPPPDPAVTKQEVVEEEAPTVEETAGPTESAEATEDSPVASEIVTTTETGDAVMDSAPAPADADDTNATTAVTTQDDAVASGTEMLAVTMNGTSSTDAIINNVSNVEGGTSMDEPQPQHMDTSKSDVGETAEAEVAETDNQTSNNVTAATADLPPSTETVEETIIAPSDEASKVEKVEDAGMSTTAAETANTETVAEAVPTANPTTAITTTTTATTSTIGSGNGTSQPPLLGRNASVGDTQPILAERQISVGAPASSTDAPVADPPADSDSAAVAVVSATATATATAADGTSSGTLSSDVVANGEGGVTVEPKKDQPSDASSTLAEVSAANNVETVPPPDAGATTMESSAEDTKAEEPVQPPPDENEIEKREDSTVPMDVDPSPSAAEATTTMAVPSPSAPTEGVEPVPGKEPVAETLKSSPVNGDKATDMDVDTEEKQTEIVTSSKPDEDQPTPMETEPTAPTGDTMADNQPSTDASNTSTTDQTAKDQTVAPETMAKDTSAKPPTDEQSLGRDPPPAALPSSSTEAAASAASVPVAVPDARGPTNPVAAAAPVPAAPSGGMLGGGGGMKELRVEDALIYLDDVKREFGDRPRVYNEFLAIMKNFKSQEVDTPGVIQRVSRLFRGYNSLILGFNKFLPDGYKITISDLEQMDAAYAREQDILRKQQLAMASKQQQPPPVGGGIGGMLQEQRILAGRQPQPPPQVVGVPAPQASSADVVGVSTQQAGLAQTGIQQHQPSQKQLPAGKKKASTPKASVGTPSVPPAAPPQQPPQPQQVHQAVEFDHAISYVTTIKRRFANDPSTYHSFLEILHTYQKEQRGIKEVLEQVAHLFQDHPDLLKEFTFFLPDAVQEQAKERLHRAAADSEARLAAKRAAQQGQEAAAANATQQKFVEMPGQPMSDVLQGRKRKDMESGGGPTPIAFPQHPDQYIYNSAVERQFFDAAKEALTTFARDGGQAWAEFLKCLDMYAQEVLSRSEMLTFVEPLLGRRNNKLFEEFKRILQFAGGQGTNFAPSLIEDAWYSVPLSEIDFNRCRKCSPSYRKLPRDYPAPPCSQRSDEEAKVLNDEWVSLPVGSEESYTFRHMRRNTYEETLFRVEDERFEIDMTIDSNLCTLALLEPFAEEMAQLSQNDLQTEDEKETAGKSRELQGLGGKLFRYTFDKNILGVIHRNSITRIYGDAGKEMLELIEKNPTVAIPLVVKRLRQKDIEWRRVRDRLNRHWKELAEHNYYKSLDHRSLTWRTTDKRALSTRVLIAEIKDRAANNGNEGQSALQARMDKAKEEHGTFYATTMASAFSRKLDLSELPKPDRRLFTPHMALMYESNTHVQKDAYRILSFALERGSVPPADKERCHRLWSEFLGPWFHLNQNWMLSPAVIFQESSAASHNKKVSRSTGNSQDGTDGDESMDEDRNGGAQVITMTNDPDPDSGKVTPCHMDHHPLPVGSTVSTVYGEGRIVACRKEDDMYVVKLAFGTAILRPSNVLCSVVAAEKSAYTTQQMVDDRTKLDRDDDMLAIGTQSLYLFFRLHQIFCRRLGVARKLAYGVKDDSSLQTLVEQTPGGDGACVGRRRYDAFMGLLFALLDGGTGTTAAEGGKFEDRVRSLLGHGGYALATMDKLIGHIVKNIQSMANDDTMWSLVQLFRRHLEAGGFKPEAFRQEAAFLSDGEPMYAFQSCPVRKDGGDKSVLYMEYLGVISGSEEEDGSVSDKASGSDAPPPPKRLKRGS